MCLKQLHHPQEVRKRTGNPIQLIDNDTRKPICLNCLQQILKARALCIFPAKALILEDLIGFFCGIHCFTAGNLIGNGDGVLFFYGLPCVNSNHSVIHPLPFYAAFAANSTKKAPSKMESAFLFPIKSYCVE